jgi:hypothetical protein
MYSDSSTKLAMNLGLVNALGWNKNLIKVFTIEQAVGASYPESTDILQGNGHLVAC